MPPVRRLLTGLLSASLLLVACGDDGDDDRAAATSIPDETSSTTTTTAKPRVPPPDVIPTDTSLITEEYVEQVLDALYEVSLEAIERARAEGGVPQAAIDLVESIRSPTHSLEALNALFGAAADGFAGYREDPAPTTADVIDVLVATQGCMFAEVVFDSSGAFSSPPSTPPNLRSFVRLIPATDEQKGSGLNPTAWVIDALPFTTDGTVPEHGC